LSDCEDPQEDHHSTTCHTHSDEAIDIASEPLANSSGQEPPTTIGEKSDASKNCRHHNHLAGDRTSLAIDKLRNYGSKEDHPFGIESTDHKSLTNGGESGWLIVGQLLHPLCIAGTFFDCAYSKIDEIEPPAPLNEIEDEVRAREDRSKTKTDEDRHHIHAQHIAQHSQQGSCSTPSDRAGDGKEDARPGSEDDEKGGDGVLPEAGGDHDRHVERIEGRR
jgi:hypothetical protein